MVVFAGSNRPLGHLVDTRILLMRELEKPDLPQEQRTQLLLKLADLQMLAQKKTRKRTIARAKNASGRKAGRPKRLHDSHGQPLYQGVKPLDASEPEDSKQKFLSNLPADETQTENSAQ